VIVLKPAAGPKARIDQLAFAPDGRSLATPVRGRIIMLWTALASGARPEVVTLPDGGATRLTFGPSGTLFAGNDQLFAVDLASRAAVRVPTDKWHSVGFGASPDGTRLVVSEYPPDGETTRLTCWPVGDFAEPLWQTTVRAHVYLPPLFPAAGDVFVQSESTRDPGTRHWRSLRVLRSLATGAALDSSKPLIEHPERIALSPDGSHFAIRVRERVYVYPGAGGWEVVQSVTNDSKKHFTGIAFHPSGRHLAATSNDATVKLYDTTTWEVIRTFTWDIGRMRSITFSPDGTLAAAGSDTGKVVVWDVDV
jgi:WD40 repeat protein